MLSLTNLQANDKVGPYIFRLEVTDSKRQNDSIAVHILVNKAVNSAPGIVFLNLGLFFL